MALVAVAAATPALAGGGGGEAPGNGSINLPAVALPITVAGRVRNYVFVTFRLHLSGDANMEAVRAKEAWFRDAIIRAAHRRSFAAPDSLVAVDANALALAMGRAARVLVGEGTIERVEIANQIPRRRTGLT